MKPVNIPGNETQLLFLGSTNVQETRWSAGMRYRGAEVLTAADVNKFSNDPNNFIGVG
jgi:hypothetical protein